MFKSMRLRLIFAYTCVAGFVTILAVEGTLLTRSMADSYDNAVQERVPQIQALAHASVAVSDMMESGLMLIHAGAETGPSASPADDPQAHFNASIQAALFWADRFGDIAEVDDDAEAAQKIKAAIQQLARNVTGLTHDGIAALDTPTLSQRRAMLSQACSQVLRQIQDAIDGELIELEQDEAVIEALTGKAFQTNLVVASAITLLTVVFGYLAVRCFSRPLNELREAAGEFGAGNLDYRMGGQKLLEFREMAAAFNGMAEKIQEVQRQREEAYKRLAEASRMAGMAEVATGVLHNVGNVLNSVNISAGRLNRRVHTAKVSDLSAVSSVLNEHAGDLGGFICKDERGRHLPAFLTEMSRHLEQVFTDMDKDVDELLRNVKHINHVVVTQQDYAMIKGVMTACDPAVLVDDALHINAIAMSRHKVRVTRSYTTSRTIVTDRHKVLQVLVNLVMNAKHAVKGNPEERRHVRIGIDDDDGGTGVVITVQDNGYGINPENLPRIFQHGFTTREEGHGFGLHNGALTARELGGSLEVASDGPGMGATFRLTLPADARQTSPGTDNAATPPDISPVTPPVKRL